MRCNESRLHEFLVMDESCVDYPLLAEHIENCERCQRRLVELSSDHVFLHEFRDTLQYGGESDSYRGTIGDSVSVSVEGGGFGDGGADCESISLDFLTAPSHPEMLGRIGRYEVERVIGSGGMGIVLKGFDTELHRVVAIKVLKPHLAHIGAARHRFAREAQSAAAVVHEHVIPIYDVQSDGEMPFLVMQYVPGQSLQSRVDVEGPLDPKEVLRIAMQAAAGLAAAHAQGLVHRDVKPANILMEESVERVLISDFGLARTVDDATLTRTGIVAGTPHYMSPEQASGHAVDHRSDLFSLGSVIYFMCTGRPPFRAEHALAVLHRICHDQHRPVDEVNHDVPADLAELVDQLLAKRAGDRIRDAREVQRRLASILAQLQRGERSQRLRWRRGWIRWRSTVQKTALVLFTLGACIVAGVGIGVGFMSGSRPGGVQAGIESLSRQYHRIERDEEAADGLEGNDSMSGAGVLAGLNSSVAESPVSPVVPLEKFFTELANVQAKVREMENPPQLSMLTEVMSADEWRQELNRIQVLVQLMEKSPTVTKSLPVPHLPIEKE